MTYGAGTSSDDVVIYLNRFCYRGQRYPEMERRYFEEYYHRDERVPRFRVLHDSRLVHVSDLFTDEEKKTSAVYNEALPLSNTQNCLTVRLDGPNGSRVFWSFANPVEGTSVANLDRYGHPEEGAHVSSMREVIRFIPSNLGGLTDSSCRAVIVL